MIFPGTFEIAPKSDLSLLCIMMMYNLELCVYVTSPNLLEEGKLGTHTLHSYFVFPSLLLHDILCVPDFSNCL